MIPTKKDIAFVEYTDEASSTVAKDALHNYKLDGEQKIKVQRRIDLLIHHYMHAETGSITRLPLLANNCLTLPLFVGVIVIYVLSAEKPIFSVRRTSPEGAIELLRSSGAWVIGTLTSNHLPTTTRNYILPHA